MLGSRVASSVSPHPRLLTRPAPLTHSLRPTTTPPPSPSAPLARRRHAPPLLARSQVLEVATGRATLFIPRLPAAYAVWMGKILGTDDFLGMYDVGNVMYVKKS